MKKIFVSIVLLLAITTSCVKESSEKTSKLVLKIASQKTKKESSKELLKNSSKEEISEKTEKEEKAEILKIMKTQEKAWSKHDLEGFMQGYWKSDSLKFYGSSGLTYGWNKTLANYKRGYPTKDHSGILKFKVNDISKITNGSYFVMGEYHLTRKVGNANGVFMIVYRKINGAWKIIADTSC